MKKLILPLLLASSFGFAADIVYYDQASLLKQSPVTKQVAQAINSKLSSQESSLLLLANQVTAQESQLDVYAGKYATYAKMPKQKQKSFDEMYDSYQQNVTQLTAKYKQFAKTRAVLNGYAADKLNAMSMNVASSYAQKNGIKAIYDYKQFRYVESSFDITGKLLPDFNAVDTSGLIGAINSFDLNDASNY